MNPRILKLQLILAAQESKMTPWRPLLTIARWTLLFYLQLERDRAFARAAAMAYITLVAIVPLLMLIFGMLNLVGVLGNGSADAFLNGPIGHLVFDTMLGDLPEVREVLLPGLMGMNFDTLGVAGIIGLVVVTGRLYMLVEETYNDIFGAVVNRTFGGRLLNFYFTLTMAPVATTVGAIGVERLHLPWTADWLQPALTFTLLLAALKTFPCTRVRWRAALAGAFVSWALLQTGAKLFPLYFLYFKSDDPLIVVYGSIGLIPVFLLWLFLLWVFVLLGVEVAYVVQNFSSLVDSEAEQRERAQDVLRVASIETALEVCARIASAFDRGEGPIEIEPLAARCQVPARDLHPILHVLQKAGLLVQAEAGGWLLARPSNAIQLAEVIDAWRLQTTLRRSGNDPIGDAVASAVKMTLQGTLQDGLRRWAPTPPAEPPA